jgi:hypothetical protein
MSEVAVGRIIKKNGKKGIRLCKEDFTMCYSDRIREDFTMCCSDRIRLLKTEKT